MPRLAPTDDDGPHPSLARHLLPSGEGRMRWVKGSGCDSRPEIPPPFQRPHRFLHRSSRLTSGPCNSPPVPLHGGLVRPATLQAAGADGAGLKATLSGFRVSGRPCQPGIRPAFNTGSRGILDRSGTGRRSSLPAGGAAVRPEHGHPTQAPGKPPARSVSLRRNGISCSHPGEGPALRLPSNLCLTGERRFRSSPPHFMGRGTA